MRLLSKYYFLGCFKKIANILIDLINNYLSKLCDALILALYH